MSVLTRADQIRTAPTQKEATSAVASPGASVIQTLRRDVTTKTSVQDRQRAASTRFASTISVLTTVLAKKDTPVTHECSVSMWTSVRRIHVLWAASVTTALGTTGVSAPRDIQEMLISHVKETLSVWSVTTTTTAQPMQNVSIMFASAGRATRYHQIRRTALIVMSVCPEEHAEEMHCVSTPKEASCVNARLVMKRYTLHPRAGAKIQTSAHVAHVVPMQDASTATEDIVVSVQIT